VSCMAGPIEVRQPAVAGTFYPADPRQCRALAKAYTTASVPEVSTHRWLGGVVPHAGWICSGAIAGKTIAAVAGVISAPDLVVIFGAIHTPIPTDLAALDSYAAWDLPGDACDVQQEIRRKMIESSGDLFRVDDRFHRREHAVEVELPLVRIAWPTSAILPIETPPNENASEIGRAVAEKIAAANRTAIFLASSDLTHYGPAYDFAPAGVGTSGLAWAKRNDLSLIEQVLNLRDEAIVPLVRKNLNACGPGAIAAMLAACKYFGATHGHLLCHANSYETLAGVSPQSPDNAVGYASIVIG
jgi:AmmeMemoRadiSam system protein B